MVSFPAAILRELQPYLDTYPIDGPDELVFVNEHGQPWHRGKLQSGSALVGGPRADPAP